MHQAEGIANAASRRRQQPWLREIAFLVLALHAIFPALWVFGVSRNGPATSDWSYFKVIAEHFVAGDWSRLYAVGDRSLNPGFIWAYPPLALYIVAPLAWLSGPMAYAAIAGVQALALAASIWLLNWVRPIRRMKEHWVFAVALSPPALTTVIMGQNSALILLCAAGAAALWSRGFITYACAVLGFLVIKPNWGIVFGFMALVLGERRGAAVMAGVAALLTLLTFPLGPTLWGDFLRASLSNFSALAGNAPQKLITLRAFLETVFGRSDLTALLWAGAVVVLVILAVRVWRAPGPPLRHIGVALLLAVAANPYVSFYDGLVLAVPATVWWTERDLWPSWSWRTVGALLLAMWVTEQWMYSWRPLLVVTGVQPWEAPVSLVGVGSAVWLVLASWQATTSGTLHRRAESRG